MRLRASQFEEKPDSRVAKVGLEPTMGKSIQGNDLRQEASGSGAESDARPHCTPDDLARVAKMFGIWHRLTPAGQEHFLAQVHAHRD
jgi:hypothetical protein